MLNILKLNLPFAANQKLKRNFTKTVSFSLSMNLKNHKDKLVFILYHNNLLYLWESQTEFCMTREDLF